MHYICKKIFLIFSLFLLNISLAQADTETYTLDSKHSYVEWRISHFGFSSPSGKWYAEGDLVLDKEKPQDSKVNVVIHLTDVITGIPNLDKHLRDKDFFDVAKFPTATFVSEQVVVTSRKTAKVKGMLTLHGVTKPITLEVTLNKVGENPISKVPTVGFSATTTLKRSDFGINAYLPELGDVVKIDIEVEATKK